MRRVDVLAAVSGLLALLLLPSLAPAQTGQGLGIVSTISGQAMVSRVSLTQPQPLRFKDSVFDRDRISTAENSTVRVLMGGKALVTVRELSVLTITEEMNRSTVDLQSGKIALGVLQQKMRPGEAIEVRTHNAVAAVRGTVIVVEIVRASAQAGGGPVALTTNVHVIHGSALVTPTNIAGASPITVAQFQTYSQIGNVLGSIRPLTPTAMNQLMSNLRSSPQFGQGSGAGAATEHIVTQEQSKASVSSFGSGTPDSPGTGGAPSAVSNQAPITPKVKILGPPPLPPPPCTPNTCRKPH